MLVNWSNIIPLPNELNGIPTADTLEETMLQLDIVVIGLTYLSSATGGCGTCWKTTDRS